MFTAGFDFICFCIGYLGMAFFMANFVFTDNPLTYFDFMLVTCPLTHYFLYRNKIENDEQKNIINCRELKEEIERLKSLTGKK